MKPVYRAVPHLLTAALVLSACAQPSPEASSQSGSPEETTPVTSSSDPASSGEEHKHTNRLIDETSPYLLQHAHNPVDWYPWGEEAFAKAREEDKPIFLSVGYSSCHWCHVMEHESFEKEDVAEIMNAHYVSIKVDREERPDVDEIYMTAVQAMTGSGGWPMSVWLTPDLKPFYGGTYFPPDERYGRPGFKTVLTRLADAWDGRRAELVSDSDKLLKHMEQSLAGGTPGNGGEISSALIGLGVRDLRKNFDALDGGFGGAPKFPSSPSIALLLRDYAHDKDERSLNMAVLTLDKMAAGGMYDHLGGGFARYSTDGQWLVPHFEKMLYDNGQLAQVYLEAYQLTGHERYRRVVEETLDYILRDMRDERGGFHSAEDADSEGQEGKFYIWDHTEIVAVLGEEDAAYFSTYYTLRPKGNFTSPEYYHVGKNILHLNTTIEDFAAKQRQSVDEAQEKLAAMKTKLLEVRSQRVRPGLDDKVLTSWNALMISAFAQGYRVLGDERYRDAAVEAATFIMTDMMTDSDLLRTHRHGESRLPAYLDDYAFMILALMDVYEATFDPQWLTEADRLTAMMNEKFWDEEAQGFYFTSDDHKNLIVRTRPTYDGALPSGNSMAALALLRLAKFLDNPDYYDKGERILSANANTMRRSPRAYIKMLCAVDFYAYPPREIAIVGKDGKEDTRALLDAVFKNFVPNKVVAFVDPEGDDAEALGSQLPLLAQKSMIGGEAAAYVCKDYACKLPVTKPADLLKQLDLSGQLGLESGDE